MIFLIAILVLIATFSTKIAARLGIPILLLFIGSGMVFGSDVLGLIEFDDAGLARHIADICLMFILFEGGFQTRRKTLDLALGPSLLLATVGVLLTAGVIGVTVHLVLAYPLTESLLVGAIISSTDAAAVMMMLRERAVRERVSATLQIESASNDPMAILLTIAMIGIITEQTDSVAVFAGLLFWQFAGGLLTGVGVGYLGRWLFNRLTSENQGYYYVLTIGVCLLAFGGADIIHANGIISVFTAGVILGNSRFAYKRGVGHFLHGISSCCNMAVFLLLGLLAFPRILLDPAVLAIGAGIAMVMMFVARPAAVFLCTAAFGYSLREKVFLMWGGIKGAVAIVLATYPAAYGLDHHQGMFHIVFFAVLFSCMLQGTTIGWAARLLKLVVPSKPKSPYRIEIMTALESELDMFELHLDASLPGETRRIRDLKLPPETLITCIVRSGRMLAPNGAMELLAEDIVFVLAHAKHISEVIAELNGQSFDSRVIFRTKPGPGAEKPPASELSLPGSEDDDP